MIKLIYIHGVILRHKPALSKISGATCSVTIGLYVVIFWITIIITCEGKKRFMGHMKFIPVEETSVSGCEINYNELGRVYVKHQCILGKIRRAQLCFRLRPLTRTAVLGLVDLKQEVCKFLCD